MPQCEHRCWNDNDWIEAERAIRARWTSTEWACGLWVLWARDYADFYSPLSLSLSLSLSVSLVFFFSSFARPKCDSRYLIFRFSSHKVKLQRDIRVAIWACIFTTINVLAYVGELRAQKDKRERDREKTKKKKNYGQCETNRKYTWINGCACNENGWKFYTLFRFEILMQFRFALSFSLSVCVVCACLFMVAIKFFMWIVLCDESEK